MKFKMRILAATLLTAIAPLALAQTTETPPPANAGQTHVATKLASSFSTLAGSPENALALVNALRNGTDVTLTTVVLPPEGSTEPPTTTTTTFTPPTGKMGWGNVKHALALAQDSLVRAGIANPTAEQLQTALVGGDIVVTNADGTTTTTSLKGILTMRADGMGWGNIAKAGGTKLGPVSSKVKMGNVKTPPPTTTTAAGDNAMATSKSKGVTTAAGTTAALGKGPSKGITTATGASAGARGLATASGVGNASPQGHAYGRGIVTAAGGSATNPAATSHGNGNGHGGGKPAGVGVVNAGGGSAAGITHAGGGNGNAGGNGKGNGKGGGKPGG